MNAYYTINFPLMIEESMASNVCGETEPHWHQASKNEKCFNIFWKYFFSTLLRKKELKIVIAMAWVTYKFSFLKNNNTNKMLLQWGAIWCSSINIYTHTHLESAHFNIYSIQLPTISISYKSSRYISIVYSKYQNLKKIVFMWLLNF